MNRTKIALTITALLAAGQIHAAGFQVSEHSAAGLGRAFAGEAAIGDNAASLARNPALMTTLDQAELSLLGSYVAPDVNITGETDADAANDVAPDQIIPSVYYVQPLSDNVAAGLGIYSNFGTGTEYENDYLNGAAAGTTHIVTVNINPNLAVKLNDHFTFGAGVSLVYTTAELKRNAGVDFLFLLDPDDSVALMEGHGYSYGWNAGALYEFNKNHRVGISYKSKSEIKLEGEYKGVGSATSRLNPIGSQRTVGGSLDVNLPSVLEVSGYHKLASFFAVSYSWMHTTWSDFGDIIAYSDDPDDCKTDGIEGLCLKKGQDFSDSNRYAVGAELYLTDFMTLRVGYALDEQAGKSTLGIPDSDREWYTAGLTIRPSDKLSLDIGAAQVVGEESTFKEEVPVPTRGIQEFTSSGGAYIYSAQLNYRF